MNPNVEIAENGEIIRHDVPGHPEFDDINGDLPEETREIILEPLTAEEKLKTATPLKNRQVDDLKALEEELIKATDERSAQLAEMQKTPEQEAQEKAEMIARIRAKQAQLHELNRQIANQIHINKQREEEKRKNNSLMFDVDLL